MHIVSPTKLNSVGQTHFATVKGCFELSVFLIQGDQDITGFNIEGMVVAKVESKGFLELIYLALNFLQANPSFLYQPLYLCNFSSVVHQSQVRRV